MLKHGFEGMSVIKTINLYVIIIIFFKVHKHFKNVCGIQQIQI